MEAGVPRILCVDDEPNILEAIQRNLGDVFDVVTAQSGAEALELIGHRAPISVIISDMRMPEMDGVTFLSQARRVAPDAIRILLTGHADIRAASAAVNEGAIFRFLTKPCPREQLVTAAKAAVEEHNVRRAEHDVLRNTLANAVKALADVLALAAPFAFRQATFSKLCVRHVVEKLHWENGWKYEMAASLSQLGCVGVPEETLERSFAGQALQPEETQMLAEHPEVGYRLLSDIPRLEEVAVMVRYQAQIPAEAVISPDSRRGAGLLRLSAELGRLRARGLPFAVALQDARRARPAHAPELIEALSDLKLPCSGEACSRLVRVADLHGFMVTDQEVRAKNGMLLLAPGQEISYPVVEKLRRFASTVGVVEPIRVHVKDG